MNHYRTHRQRTGQRAASHFVDADDDVASIE